MDLNTFLDHFDTIAQSPNGIPKLRSLILNLAVRGKLASQNSEDEPASIEGENTLEIDVKNLPELPKNWILSTVNNACSHIVDCPHSTAKFVSEGFYCIDTNCISQGRILFEKARYVTEETFIQRTKRLLPAEGDILFSREGTIGVSAIVPSDIKLCLGQRMMMYRVHQFLDSSYFLYFLSSPFFKEQLEQKITGTAAKHVNIGDIKKMVVIIPPIAEQKQIVEKVDELMALCDRLQASQESQTNLRQKLRESAIASLMNAETDEELQKNWAIVRDNWGTLCQKPEDVDELRRSVLQLAYSGKLTKRSESDINVDSLFFDIKEERELLLRKLRFRDPAILEEVKADEELFSIPREWKWIRIGHAFLISSGTTPSRVKPEYFEDGTEYWVKTTDLNNSVVLGCEEKITKAAVKDCNLKYYPVGTVCVALYGGSGTIGKSGLLGIETTINQSVCGVYPNKHIFPPYLHWYIKLIRPVWMRFAASLRKAPNINAGVVNNMVFPLASFEEQRRIVAKVDELMQMCDRLEQSLRQTQQQAEAIAASAIEHLRV